MSKKIQIDTNHRNCFSSINPFTFCLLKRLYSYSTHSWRIGRRNCHYRILDKIIQKHLFVTKSSPYNIEPENIENIFVRNIENIISSENNKWKTVNTNEKKVENTN